MRVLCWRALVRPGLSGDGWSCCSFGGNVAPIRGAGGEGRANRRCWDKWREQGFPAEKGKQPQTDAAGRREGHRKT